MNLPRSIPQVLLLCLLVVVAGAFVVGGATSTAAFDSFNPAWDGTSELRSTAEAADSEPTIITDTTHYDRYGAAATAFILAPDRAYSDADSRQLHAFVERGGTLVVADRGGAPALGLLDAIGANARPNGAIIRDERTYYREPALPIATTTAEQTLLDPGVSVTLNYGTAVDPNSATVIARSSEYAYLDRDNSSGLSPDETLQSYPVVTLEEIGEGRVVVVGDPSVFINVMQEREGNRELTSALIDGRDRTLIDVSHSRSPPLLQSVLLMIRDSSWLQFGLGMMGLAAIGLWRRRSVWNP